MFHFSSFISLHIWLSVCSLTAFLKYQSSVSQFYLALLSGLFLKYVKTELRNINIMRQKNLKQNQIMQ